MSSEGLRWQHLYSTRDIVSEILPYVEILSLPPSVSGRELLSLDALREEILKLAESGEPGVAIAGVDEVRHDEDICLRSLIGAVQEMVVRGQYPASREEVTQYAEYIYTEYELPVVRSPLDGKALAELAKLGAVGAGPIALAIAFPHITLGTAAVYLVLVAGVPIIVGAADGIANGLRKGLELITLKWLGVSPEQSTPVKKAAHKEAEPR